MVGELPSRYLSPVFRLYPGERTDDLMSANYDRIRSYPVVCCFHGGGGDEKLFTNAAGCARMPETMVFASYRQQTNDPAIVLWPTPSAGQFFDHAYRRP